MDEHIYYSRPVATAAKLGDLATDRHRFVHKRVLVTGESTVLAANNGRECLLSSLRLLIRICPNVSVALPVDRAELVDECRQALDPLTFGHALEYLTGIDGATDYDAVLSIGTAARPELPWTVINSNGWLARVSSGPMSLSSDCEQDNPIGALAAASLGVADVFKRLIRLRPTRGKLLDGLSFSLYTYQSGETDPGPPLWPELTLRGDLLIVGAGAIGNGVLYLLSKLPLTGRAWIVDAQDLGPENYGTCILIGPADIGKAKATFGAGVLGRRMDARGFREDFASFKRRLGSDLPYPRVVIGGVDNIDARHEIQHLWADLTIDGAIGDFGCQVSRHPWGDDTACLICLFRQPAGEPAEQVGSRLTSLRVHRAAEGLATITEDDVREAPVEKREWLRARLGHHICSVIQEAVAQHLSEEQQRQGFEPSVPFVACFSASMVVAELVRYVTGWPTPLEPRYQLDMLQGPAFGLELPQERRQDCVCVTRRHNIEKLRRRRAEVAR